MVVQLTDTAPSQSEVPRLAWVDKAGTATLEQVQKLPSGSFAPAPPDTLYRLGATQALWLHVRVLQQAESRKQWRLSFPLPILDEVTVYQQDAQGRWQSLTAGDTIANDLWPESGRYPYFALEAPAGQLRDVFVRVAHATPLTLPVRVNSEVEHDKRLQHESLALGAVFGAMLLLVLSSVAQGLVYHERIYGWYSLYATIVTLAVAAYTGVAGQLLWSGLNGFSDTSQYLLGTLACACGLLFVRYLCGVAVRYKRFDLVLRYVSAAGVLAAFSVLVLPKAGYWVWIFGATSVSCVGLGIAAAYLTMRRGDTVGYWVLLALAPMTIAVTLVLLRLSAWGSTGWWSQYAAVVGMALEVPLMLVALSVRLRERLRIENRAQTLTSHDALTGLLTESHFRERLRDAVGRAKRDQAHAAVVMVDLVNAQAIRHVHGSSVVEQSLLRAVIKLRRVLRDVDTVGRVGDARFGLILEGVNARASVTGRIAQLIAMGLMPPPGLRPEVTLHFHASAVLLSERVDSPSVLLSLLSDVVDAMSPRTRRPIRFVEPEETRPMEFDPQDSALVLDSRPQNT